VSHMGVHAAVISSSLNNKHGGWMRIVTHLHACVRGMYRPDSLLLHHGTALRKKKTVNELQCQNRRMKLCKVS